MDHRTERFVRNEKSTGAGLGLTDRGAVVESHRESVAIANASGATEASLTLPIARARLQ